MGGPIKVECCPSKSQERKYKDIKREITQTIDKCNNSNKHIQKIATSAGHCQPSRKRTNVKGCNLHRPRNTILTNTCHHAKPRNNFDKYNNKKQTRNIASQAGQKKVEGSNLQRARNKNPNPCNHAKSCNSFDKYKKHRLPSRTDKG